MLFRKLHALETKLQYQVISFFLCWIFSFGRGHSIQNLHCAKFCIKVRAVLRFMKRDKPNTKNITERTKEIKGYAIRDVTEPHRTSDGMKVPMADKIYITRSQTFDA